MTKSTCECANEICITFADIIQKELLNLTKNSNYSNKQRRFHAYRAVAANLGCNYRQKLPDCVEKYIKATFPEDTCEYTGFKPKQ